MIKITLKQAQKRIRKEIRLNRLLRKGETIVLIDDGSAEAKLGIYFLREISLPINLKITKTDFLLGKPIKGDKIIVPWNADMEDEYFLDCIFKGKRMDFLGHYKLKSQQYIKLLLPLLSREVKELAGQLKIKYIEKKSKSVSMDILNKLEKEYPEIKFSLLKSIQEFRK